MESLQMMRYSAEEYEPELLERHLECLTTPELTGESRCGTTQNEAAWRKCDSLPRLLGTISNQSEGFLSEDKSNRNYTLLKMKFAMWGSLLRLLGC
jgi:hypothetical protein